MTIRIGITLVEYNRRWDMIMQAFHAGFLNRWEAMDAIRELTNCIIWH